MIGRPERGILVVGAAALRFGLVMVYSASAVLGVAEGKSPGFYFEAQLAKLVVGLILLVSFWRLDYHWLRRRASPWTAMDSVLASLAHDRLGIGVAQGARFPLAFGLSA